MSAREAVLWDMFEEHWAEAAFVWEQWETALVSASCRPQDVLLGPEERLRANLDALVIGGDPVAHHLLLPGLAHTDPLYVLAAAWALLHSEHGDYLPSVLPVLRRGKTVARAAVARALAVSEDRSIWERIHPLWCSADVLLQCVIVDLAAVHEPQWLGQHLSECLASGNACLVTTALRALRRHPIPELAPFVERAIDDPNAHVRREGLAAGFQMNLPGVLEACAHEVHQATVARRLALAVLALANTPEQRAHIETALAIGDARRDAVWALGFAGDVSAGDWLVELMREESLAPLAAESLATITNLDLSGPFALPGRTGARLDQPVEADDPPPDVCIDDRLVTPDVQAIATWWRRERSARPRDHLYVYGQPRSPASLSGAIMQGTMWRREVFAIELGAEERRGVSIDLRGWVRHQVPCVA